MKQSLFSVYDLRAKMYSPPWACMNDEVAIREFGLMCRAEKSPIGKYPEDYELVILGSWDTETGQLFSAERVERVMRATELVEQNRPMFPSEFVQHLQSLAALVQELNGRVERAVQSAARPVRRWFWQKGE